MPLARPSGGQSHEHHDVKDRTGKLIARAASTCMRLKLDSKPGASAGVPTERQCHRTDNLKENPDALPAP
jgi:hypothetical protein